jgi:hypothetical protein
MSDISPDELARRGYSAFLKAIAERRQGDIANAMGLSDTNVSELKTKHMERCIALLAHCGLKLAPADARVLPEVTYQFLTVTHQRVMARDPHLVFDAEL